MTYFRGLEFILDARLMRRMAALATGALTVLAGSVAVARQEAPAPDLAPAVLTAMEAEYLSDEERSELRLFHGVWKERDLNTPARRAKAALMLGVFDDPALSVDHAEPEDRAEAALRSGNPQSALELLAGEQSMRARRLRAESLEMLGRFEEANRAIDPIVEDLMRNILNDAASLTEAVRALIIRARLEGRPASDYRHMMSLLSRASQDLDRLYWPAKLVEAQLLYDKDNRGEAARAAMETLSLNPACAEAWGLLGRLGVDSFNFAGAEGAARRLTGGARRFTEDSSAVSPSGSLLLARVAIRQKDAALAQQHVREVLDRYPNMREALALQCAAAALEYEFDETDRLLAEFNLLSPGSPLALFEVGQTLSEHRQYERAAAYLEQALARQPNWPAPVIELGLLELQSGRDVRALTALRRAAELDSFNVRAKNSLKLIEELMRYVTVESDNFVVRYKPGIDGVLAKEMPAILESMHQIVAEAFHHEPSRKTTIELMPDHQWFAVRITGMPGIHTIAASTGPVIAMESPKIGKTNNGEYDWVRVVRHEYTHTVTLSRTKNRIPHWFTEAAAVYLELSPRDYETWLLLLGALTNDALFDMEQINIAFVRPKRPTDRSLAYAQGHWMYEFIVERWGENAPLELMDRYAEGLTEESAMPEVLGMSPEQFRLAFIEWARDDAERHGLLPTPSLSELLLNEAMTDSEARSALEQALSRSASIAAHALAGAADEPDMDMPLPSPSLEMVDRWLVAMPNHPDVLELKLTEELRLRGGEADDSLIALLEQYAAARIVDPMPHRQLARLYLDSDEPHRAIEHLEYLDAREQKSAAYALGLARLYAEAGEWEKAEQKADRATNIAPFDANNRELAATIAMQSRDFDAAERHIAALVEIEPDREQHRKRLEAVRRLLDESPTSE